MLNNIVTQPKPLRGALFGAGSVSRHHMLAWKEISGVSIVAIANRTRERAIALGNEFGIDDRHIYENYQTLLEQEDLDFVDIATAPHLHSEQVIAAAGKGVQILCQKPFATSLEEAHHMVEVCERARVRCVVHENWRWRPHYRRLKQMLSDSVIGPLENATFHYHGDDVLPESGGGLPTLLVRQPYTAQMPRLILFEWGIHLIDVMRFLFGEVRGVSAKTESKSPLVQGEDRAVVELEFASGMTGTIDISWSTAIPQSERLVRGQVESLRIEGALGSLELVPQACDELRITTADLSTRCKPANAGMTRAEVYQQSYFDNLKHFVTSLQTQSPAENEARENLKTLAVVMAAYDSAEQGQPVVLNGVPLKSEYHVHSKKTRHPVQH